jgi:ABC-2 type transport system ATP-binding protein
MIEIDNLSKNFGHVRALDGISLRVEKGELFCFLGPNGAGKTTAIKILTGLLRPTSGSARIGGVDIGVDPLAAKQLVGYVPDMPFLYERLTATEFFQFTGDLYGVPKEKTAQELDRLFSMFGLLEQRASLVKDLSHGMRQRLIYASTLLHDPSVLFIDEPLIGLDPYTIRLVKDLLVNRARSGMTIFLTTHILALAEDIADRIGIISNGRILAVGTFAELAERHGGGKNLEELFLRLTDESRGSREDVSDKSSSQQT